MSAREELSGTYGEVRERWSRGGAGERYARQRFSSARSARRDVRIVERLLREHGVRGEVLDVPCGAGRLQPMLASAAPRVVGADVSRAMLAEARRATRAPLVEASIDRLPFAGASFDVVVCCRLLHHLGEGAELERAVRELVRVSSRLVIASFWDAGSLPAWRARVGLARQEGRSAIARERIESVFDDADADVLGYRGTLRFVSKQTFAVARTRAGGRS